MQVTKEGTSSEPLEPCPKNSEGFDKTNLQHVDISVDVDSEEEFYSEKEREQEKDNRTSNIFATGGQQVPASKPPATGSTSPPSNKIPPTTTPVDPTVFEQPEVLNTTPVVTHNAADGQPLQLSIHLLIFTNSFPGGYLRVET